MHWHPGAPPRRRCLAILHALLDGVADFLFNLLDKRLLGLSRLGKTHHQLGDSNREVSVEVVLPSVPGLAVGINEFFHQLVLDRLRYSWRRQLARFNFVLMTVPIALFLLGQ